MSTPDGDFVPPPGGMFEQYMAFHRYASNKYGSGILVLYHEGSFYETMAMPIPGSASANLASSEFAEVDLRRVSALLDDSEIYTRPERNGVCGVGLPVIRLDEGMEKLLKGKVLPGRLITGYATLVIVSQVGDEATKPPKKKRRITAIHTLGTIFPSDSSNELRYVTHIYIEEPKTRGRETKSHYNPYYISVASISTVTGHAEVLELQGYDQAQDQYRAIDSIAAHLKVRTASELLVTTRGVSEPDRAKYIARLELANPVIRPELPREYYDVPYQRQALGKAFNHSNPTQTVHQWLGFERLPAATLAYLGLIQYIYERAPTLLGDLKKPEIINPTGYLALTNDSMTQLGLIGSESDGAEFTVCGLYNQCATAMGQRLLRRFLLFPLTDPQTISERYDEVDRAKSGRLWERISSILVGVPDLERLHRKLDLGILTPFNASMLIKGYHRIRALIEVWDPPKPIRDQFEDYLGYLAALDTERASQFAVLDAIGSNVFHSGSRPGLDSLMDRVAANVTCRDLLAAELSGRILKKKTSTTKKGKKTVVMKVPEEDSTEPTAVYVKSTGSEYYFTVTDKRMAVLRSSLSAQPLVVNHGAATYSFDLSNLLDRTSRGIVGFTTEAVSKLSDEYYTLTESVAKATTDEYRAFLREWTTRYRDLARDIAEWVGQVDVYASAAKVATKYKYCRPTIVPDSERSFVRAKQLRHPLVERAMLAEYVPHDVSIGVIDPDIPSAVLMLLCGMNTAGKSTVMRELVSVVAAQAGFFVPAESFTFSPFEAIYTRILTKDSLGTSSYQRELLELGPMLSRSNNRTLILADELCHSTGFYDAQTIVKSTLEHLGEVGACGIFTTHLTELAGRPDVGDIPGLRVYHVEMQIEGLRINYKRTLKPGCGPQVYGVEVAAACGLPPGFIERAYRNRRLLMNESEQFLSFKQSRYNSDKRMDGCNRCGSRDLTKLQTHHIRPQASADSDGFVGHVPLHAIYNLEGLCEDCHRIETYGDH